MNLEAIAPILEQIIKETLDERRYRFGFANNTGISNKVASGSLRNSVSVTVQKNSNTDTVLQVMMEEYFQYVQSGRLPGRKFVPIQSLEKWIRDRRLKGRDKKGRFMTNKSFAFAIAKNINKFGIRPSNFLDISIEKILKDEKIVELLQDAAYEDLINAIQGI